MLAICHEPRFASLPPSQVVPLLADEKCYIASESTFYRVLRRAGETTHRGRQMVPQSRPLSTLTTDAGSVFWPPHRPIYVVPARQISFIFWLPEKQTAWTI